MAAPKVILQDQRDYHPDEIAAKTGAVLESLKLDLRGKSLFIKPSFVYPSKSQVVKGVITHPLFQVGLVLGAVDAFLDRFGPGNIRPMNVILGKPQAIENHAGLILALKDFILQARFHGQMNPTRGRGDEDES